jgi:tetratricopeptide (TPR) repeat protein
MNRIDPERDNVRTVLSWSLACARHGADGLRLATAMGRYWMWRGFYSEGRDWLVALLATTREEDASEHRASAYRWAGNFATRQADYGVAQEFHEGSLAIYKQLDDVAGVSNSLTFLGTIARNRGEYGTARALYFEVLEIKRRLADSIGVGRALINLGYLASEQGDYAAARETFQESLSILRELGHWQASHVLYHLGIVSYCESDFVAARGFLEQALNGYQGVENQQGVAECLAVLGIVAHDCGDGDLALVRLKEALALQLKLGDRRNMAESLEAFAAVVSTRAAVDLAARIWGCSERMREDICAPVTPSQRGWHDRQIAAARALRADDLAFDRSWAEGRCMSLDAALRETLGFEATTC